ncbi:unnamed protein product [Strongylus vulgaris]|uniref:Uncharacterized protein n=1 Tax=Strongylus vulgaris TaxID=40348 RepID=A0A3P7JCD5_STRVU|nr:unnamed protein product [Strongylus vulgaris]
MIRSMIDQFLKAVQKAFEKAQKSCTTIQIVDGTIAEEGTHEQLLNKHGIYYEMTLSS